jgi:serine phosphatase RsbU (regulator of sigma subunit)
VLIGRSAIEERYPDLERAAPGERSMVGLPLRVVGRVLGVVTLSFPGRRQLDTAEYEFFRILADSCAQALERIRAREAAVQQAARVRFLADATSELAASLDYEMTLANVARLVVPAFADWCAIDVVEDGQLHRLAVEHVDPSKVRLALEVQERYPPDPDSGAWRVIRTGESVFVAEITDEMLEGGIEDAEQLALMRQLQLRSVIMVPLTARGITFGALTWVYAESGRLFAEDDVAFAVDLAKRAAIAIDNSQLYSQTQMAAVQLQHAVLPQLAARFSGWEVASYYSPAGRTEVGGDFYDVVPLPDGRLAAFVGDVMGRGVAAAAAMAQMRSAVRAYLAVDPAPEVVLGKLELLFATYDVGQLVTLVYLLLDPGRDSVVMANAGHPAPMVLRADGAVADLASEVTPPLGAPLSSPRTATVDVVRRGDIVLAFTDGLVERRGEDIDEGRARLARSLHGLRSGPLHACLTRLVGDVRDHEREDDVAALALHRTR